MQTDRVEVGRGVERAAVGRAVRVRLARMLMAAELGLEDAVADVAGPVLVLLVVAQLRVRVEEAAAQGAVRVVGRVGVVRVQRPFGRKAALAGCRWGCIRRSTLQQRAY